MPNSKPISYYPAADINEIEAVLNYQVEAQKWALALGSSVDSVTPGAANAAVNNSASTSAKVVNYEGVKLPPNAQIIWEFLTKRHSFTNAAAAGVIGNLMAESSCDPKKYQLNGGVGRGIMQWTENGRWAMLLAWAKRSGKDPWELETQMEYMIIEMKNPEFRKSKALTLKVSVYDHLKTLTDPISAANVFESQMERAGIPHMERRHQFAMAIYSYNLVKGVQ